VDVVLVATVPDRHDGLQLCCLADVVMTGSVFSSNQQKRSANRRPLRIGSFAIPLRFDGLEPVVAQLRPGFFQGIWGLDR